MKDRVLVGRDPDAGRARRRMAGLDDDLEEASGRRPVALSARKTAMSPRFIFRPSSSIGPSATRMRSWHSSPPSPQVVVSLVADVLVVEGRRRRLEQRQQQKNRRHEISLGLW